LYYKKSTDANSISGWKFVQATNGVSPFTFNLNLSLLNSAAVGGDVIQYFVLAQDSASSPNIGLSSGLSFPLVPGSVALQTGNFPIIGTPSTFTIPVTPKTLSSVTVTQPQAYATVPSATSFPVLALTYVVAGNSGTLPLNSLVVNLPGTSVASDISRVRLYINSTPNFRTATQIGSTSQNFSSGTVTFNAENSGTGMPYDIPTGTSYMWVTYDIASNAVVNNSLDATIPANGITVGSSTYNTTVSNPTGVAYIFNNINSFEAGNHSFYRAGSFTNFTIGDMPTSDLSNDFLFCDGNFAKPSTME
jgi:hypothetical protein